MVTDVWAPGDRVQHSQIRNRATSSPRNASDRPSAAAAVGVSRKIGRQCFAYLSFSLGSHFGERKHQHNADSGDRLIAWRMF